MKTNMLISLMIIFFIYFVGCEKSKQSIIEPDNTDNTDIVEDLGKINTQVVQTNNEFGFDLFKTINPTRPDSNIFISPLSVSIALGMAVNGANGSTRDEILTMLDLADISEEQINETYQQLIALLLNNDEQVLFEIANSIWYDQNRMVPEQDFLTVNQNYFFADVLNINFSSSDALNTINGWISDKTHGKIENMLDCIPGDAVLYIINALYFYGQWLYTFDKEETEERPFVLLDNSSVECPLMAQKSEFEYYANDMMQMIDLKYANSDYSMTIVLPAYNININTMINDISNDTWNGWIDSLNTDSVTIHLPKFKTEYNRLLNDDLKALGMQEAFDQYADFTRIYPPGSISISRVLHKAFIEVNEEGSKAAAATIIEIKWESAGPMHPEIYINRPFLLVIREHETNTILFIGKIVNPVE